ncbi:MAG: SMP-30/gluconolactonase/LRE family protein [Cypionkella sp.]|nr:SMP-30/gluconolactonase/LRE family protein [Cypionkella sp.]
MIYDARRCELGEGPLWHPTRGQLFWFDILNKKLLSRLGDTALEWQFDQMVSAAGWVSDNELLIASETQLLLFNLDTSTQRHIAPLEADNKITRSNDGRADPQGGFWIGTMGKSAEKGAGAIYRFYRGELRRLYSDITISNAICFAPDGRAAYFTDTVTARVMRVGLDNEGWPHGAPQVYLDLPTNPDGAVIDAAGNMWLAEWGSSRVGCYDPSGQMIGKATFDAPNTSCPAFGGADLTTLYCTTAQQHMDAATRAAHPHSGKVFAAVGAGKGQAEHRVIL